MDLMDISAGLVSILHDVSEFILKPRQQAVADPIMAKLAVFMVGSDAPVAEGSRRRIADVPSAASACQVMSGETPKPPMSPGTSPKKQFGGSCWTREPMTRSTRLLVCEPLKFRVRISPVVVMSSSASSELTRAPA